MYLDKNYFLQNNEGISILHHMYRRSTDKKITNNSSTIDNKRFDTSISNTDLKYYESFNQSIIGGYIS